MTTSQIQELLLATLPQWHYRLAKPFKQLLDEGMSLEMYYCIQTLRLNNNEISMTELANITKMPKQQMTKMVNRLIDCKFVERVPDPDDRRIIKLKITKEAIDYIDRFLDEDAVYYKTLFDSMEENDKENFAEALLTIHNIFNKMPCETSVRHHTMHKIARETSSRHHMRHRVAKES